MRLDKDYKVPEGFLPVLNYRNTQDGEPVVGECRLPVPGGRGDLRFWIGDPPEAVPVLPLKAHGELWHRGWDIPTVWAVDGSGKCWRDNAHGHCLGQVSAEALLGTAESEGERNRIRKALGLPPEESEWMRLARAAGWRPPGE